MKTTRIAVNIPRRIAGRKTRKKAWSDEAPRSRAASVRRKSNFSAAA